MRRPRTTKPGNKKRLQTALSPAEKRRVRLMVPKLIRWFDVTARDLPWRRTRDPYRIWVSEIMLQQTQVKTVIPYWQRWIRELPDLRALSRASSQKLHKLWEGLGYYTRVRNMQKAAHIICKQHDEQFPTSFEDVLALPGIGRYTAGAVCSIAFNAPAPILDGNVIRVLARVLGIKTDPREATTNARLWHMAEALVTQAAKHNRQVATPDRHSEIRNHTSVTPPCSALNQSLMELGATVCTPRNPICTKCPIRRQCTASLQGLTSEIPLRASRPKIVSQQIKILVAEHRGRFWATRRPQGSINGGLWEFPQFEEVLKPPTASTSNGERRGRRVAEGELLGTFKHTITCHRITAKVYLRRTGTEQLKLEKPGRWFSPTALKRAPLSALHRRIANQLLEP